MIRITNPDIVREALKLYPSGEVKFNVEEWLADPRAIVLSDEDGNLGMFEEYIPGVYSGHYFFKASGKSAKELAIIMLREAFTTYGAEAIRGLTPRDNKPALWMTRQLGFKSYGEVPTHVGPCTVFVMTKDEFNILYGLEE